MEGCDHFGSLVPRRAPGETDFQDRHNNVPVCARHEE